MSRFVLVAIALAFTGGCSREGGGNYRCGFAAVAGQSTLLDQFNRPGTVLARLPPEIPETLPVRVSLGPAFRSITGRADSLLVVGVQGALPGQTAVGFGVLVVSPTGKAEGVVLYEGEAIRGAPRLGTVNAAGRDLPLIGLLADLSRFQKESCPIFPDSLRQ